MNIIFDSMRKYFLLLILWQGIAISQSGSLYKELMIYSDVINQVRLNYLEDVPPNQFIDASIRGLLSSLDPHSVYLDSSDFTRFQNIMDGKLPGVGLEFDIIHGRPTVISIIEGTPAEDSPVRIGDQIMKVNGVTVIDKPYPEIKFLLSGDEGSVVTLTMVRLSDKKEYTVAFKRKIIPIETITTSFMLNDTVGYVRISQFLESTFKDFKNAIEDLCSDGMRYLVIDLRNNPGGRVDVTEQILDLYIPEGNVIYRTYGRKEEIKDTIYATKVRKQQLYPIMILINNWSASASELLAGVLQDYDRALILGTNSFGKGLIQRPFLLSNGKALLMTVGKYFTPSGRSTQRSYRGKSLIDYFENQQTDSVDISSDILYKTKHGRIVDAGRGIKPDVMIDNDTLFSDDLINILISPAVSNFSELLWKTGEIHARNLNEFRKSYSVSEKQFEYFIQNSINQDLDTALVRRESTLVKLFIKMKVAERKWGINATQIIKLENRASIKKSLNYLKDAAALLSLE